MLHHELEGRVDELVEEVERLENQRAELLVELVIKVVKEVTKGDVRSVNMGNGRNGCLYKEFIACNPKDYDVNEVQTRVREVAVGMTWEDFMDFIRLEFCPNNEMQKLETKFWCHAMVGAGHAAYTDRFYKLARLVPHLVTPKNKRIKRYIYSLTPQIRVMVAATEPTTIQSAELGRKENVRDDNKRFKTGRVFATITKPVRKEYTSTSPKCTNCSFHHNPEMPCRKCTNYNHLGNFARDCRVGPRMVTLVSARNPTTARGACFECCGTDHYKAAYPWLNRAPRPGENFKTNLWLLREVKVMETMEIRHVEEHS
nr:reverse transcriptase domain-containing protein [Tanacetum cinerariifolium]